MTPVPTRTVSQPPPSDVGGTKLAGGRAPLAVLFLTVFLDLVGFGIVIPLLPLYAETFGAGPVAVTMLVAVYSLMQFVFAPWWGRISDRFGRRPILIIGLFGSAISYIAFGLAGSLAVLFGARILAGFMGANVGVAQAYVADVTDPADRARGMGLIGAAFGLGFIFGPVIGGLLAPYGAAVPFLAAGTLAFLNALLAIARLPESLPHTDRSAAPPSFGAGLRERVAGARRAFRDATLARLYSVFFLVTFAFAALEATFSLWADRAWALSPAEIAYVFAYIGVLVVIVQGFLVGRLSRRWGDVRLAVTGAVVLAAGLAAIPVAPSPLLLALALAGVAFGQGTTTPAISALVSRRGGRTDQGTLLGVSQSLSALGRVVGPVLAGVLFAGVGIGAPYFMGGILVAGAGVILLPLLSTGGSDR